MGRKQCGEQKLSAFFHEFGNTIGLVSPGMDIVGVIMTIAKQAGEPLCRICTPYGGDQMNRLRRQM